MSCMTRKQQKTIRFPSGLMMDVWPNSLVGGSRRCPSRRAKSRGVQGLHHNSYPGSGSWKRGSCSPAAYPGTTLRCSPLTEGPPEPWLAGAQQRCSPSQSFPPGHSPMLRSRFWQVLDLLVPVLLHWVREAGSRRGRDLREPKAATSPLPQTPGARGERRRG